MDESQENIDDQGIQKTCGSAAYSTKNKDPKEVLSSEPKEIEDIKDDVDLTSKRRSSEYT